MEIVDGLALEDGMNISITPQDGANVGTSSMPNASPVDSIAAIEVEPTPL